MAVRSEFDRANHGSFLLLMQVVLFLGALGNLYAAVVGNANLSKMKQASFMGDSGYHKEELLMLSASLTHS